MPDNSQLAHDWIQALTEILQSGLMLEKNFCFLGFPHTARNLEYLCQQLNRHTAVINQNLGDRYYITEVYTPDNLIASDLGPNHNMFNVLHNHFERLQGTVNNLSEYYLAADAETKYAIRQLNNICHEAESYILTQRKVKENSQWIRPSQITTWLTAPRYRLTDEHRQGFLTNGYDREFGRVYMHWAQIGKTYYEVYRDEHAPELTGTVCEAITALEFYTGEFDIEWARSITYRDQSWWREQMDPYYAWLEANGVDRSNVANSLGYLPIGQVDLMRSFGTTDPEQIWQMLGSHLDIYSIDVNGVQAFYSEVWSDDDYDQKQIEKLKPGYHVHRV